MKQQYTTIEKFLRVLMYITLGLVGIIMVYPFYYVIIYAISDSNAAIAQRVFLWPVQPTLQAFKNLLSLNMLWVSYRNSIIVTLTGTLIAVAVTATLAYPLSVKRLRGRKVISMLLFFTMIFNGGMIANYLLIKDLRLLNTFWALILPPCLNPYNVLILRSFFSGIPGELEESASIDGATPLKILIRIILPISLPGLAVQMMFYGIAYWNSYFDCVLYINSSSLLTLQAYLRTLISNFTAQVVNDASSLDTQLSNETIRMACVAVAVIPVLIIYPALQKYYVKGMVVGSVKG